jgi:hypothetical protein
VSRSIADWDQQGMCDACGPLVLVCMHVSICFNMEILVCQQKITEIRSTDKKALCEDTRWRLALTRLGRCG